MRRYETAKILKAYRKKCEDRIEVFEDDERTVIVVADGAGGIGNGDIAAETVIREVESVYRDVETPERWASVLKQIDFRIGVGESTAVVLDVRPEILCGASVGDSQAWNIDYEDIINLTAEQECKPLLGSGDARPVAFETTTWSGLLLVASDGFSKYVKRDSLTAMVAQNDFYSIPRLCVEMVQLPSGDLWDDIGIVICRLRPRHRTRRRYSI